MTENEKNTEEIQYGKKKKKNPYVESFVEDWRTEHIIGKIAFIGLVLILVGVIGWAIYTFNVVIPEKKRIEDEAYQQMLQQQSNKNNGTDIKPGTDNSGDNNGNNVNNDNNNGNGDISAVVTVTVAPTNTVVPTVTSTPTSTPLPTPTPKQIPTSTPTCTPTCTLTPTATLTPTSTPIPTPVMSDEVAGHKYTMRYKVGDNIWVEYYADGSLRMTGTGKTYDYDDVSDSWLNKTSKYKYNCNPSAEWKALENHDFFIDEGITYIGRFAVVDFELVTSVNIPSSVKEIASGGFYIVGNENTVWNGITDNIKLNQSSFAECKGIGLAEAEESSGLNLSVLPTPTCTPTPTATPTPFPKADPANPILLFTDKPYDNITVEVWDNGYAYVKGSGDFDAVDWNYWGFTMRKMGDNRKALDDVVTHLIIEEGITSLGIYTLDFAGSRNLEYIQVPSTLKSCDKNSLQGSGEDVDVFEFNLGGKTVYFDQAQQRKDKQIFESANAYVQVGRIINVEMFGVNGFDIGFAGEKYLYR